MLCVTAGSSWEKEGMISKDFTVLCLPSIVLFLLYPEQIHTAAPSLCVPGEESGRAKERSIAGLAQQSQSRLGAVSETSAIVLLAGCCPLP